MERASTAAFVALGLLTALRESVLAHQGEAESSRVAFLRSSEYEPDSRIEFPETLPMLSQARGASDHIDCQMVEKALNSARR